MRLSLLLPLFVLGGLVAGQGRAHAQMMSGRYNQPLVSAAEAFRNTTLSIPFHYQMPRQITVHPTIPVGTDGAIKTEPDTATRRLYARNKVRSVMKVRMNRKGEAEDTLEYQLVDRQGRWEEAGTGTATVQRQWSYNRAGQCTSLIEYPSLNRSYTVITTYNPALQRGQQEVLQPDGQRNIVSAKQLYHSGDTLMTEIKAKSLRVKQYSYPQYHQRSIRLALHPDTVLSLTCFYDQNQKPTSYQANYLFYRHGRLLESGKLNLASTAQAQGVSLPADRSETIHFAQVLAALRAGAGLELERSQRYDAQHRLIWQGTTSIAGNTGQHVSNSASYTYNILGQLLGREEILTLPMAPPRTSYTVYSYSPQGLLSGETTNVKDAKVVYYRYFYLYHE